MSKSPKLVLRATTSGKITQSGAAAGHSTNMVEAARPAIKILIKQSPILTGHHSHVVEASKPVIKASTSGVIKQNLVAAGHSSNMADASESVVKATTSGITTQSPKIDKFNIVKSPDVPQSVAVAQPPTIDGSNIASTSQNGVISIQLYQEYVENICRNIPEEYHGFPARLRVKRYLAEMTHRNLPGVVQHTNADETDETPTKRRRE
ncbi:uncharacterized protein LOC119067852 isoform X1 [Bradysia coprophila]|uniref:uncharacterized protein LOC119067852 isoform X1 n=1 Tax=Bradysia coprophila TaxID=38358 RepID=UPI00187D9239|nr:uncharacterized protein LOC119067852 isoform X1 [Bradysia coprophila]